MKTQRTRQDVPPGAQSEARPAAESRALVPHILGGEPDDALIPAIRGAGVDSLEFSFDVLVSEAMWQHLDEEREIAQLLAKERRAVHVPEWLNAEISPTGAQGGYRFLLQTPTFAIKLLQGIPNRPPIYVEMRAFGLHTHEGGVIGACEAACAYIREVLLADQDLGWAMEQINLDTARCSRLDLYLDWQRGWHPAFTSGDEQHFVKRVHADVGRYSCDGQVTGLTIGSSAVRARLYNKSVQAKKKHLDWYPELLRARHGLAFDEAGDLWRVEFQLRREGVKGFKLRAQPEMSDPDDVIDAELKAEDLPHIGSVHKALHWAGQLWEYLTKRWLRLVVPTADPNRGRWPEHPTGQRSAPALPPTLWPVSQPPSLRTSLS